MIRALLLVVLATWSAPVHAFAGYAEHTLPNGLRVVLIEHRANPMVASTILVGAGVLHEKPEHAGGSHLLEHLLFNGTTTRTQRELYDAVDRLGAYNNAATREDHTLFTMLVQKEFAEQGLEIQADMLLHSTIPAESFDKEKGIVLEEMARSGADPGTIAEQRFREHAFAGTPLARPVLGTTDSIAAMPRDAVVAYYRERYVPENMLVVLMGDFESATMMATVERLFGGAARGRPGQATAAKPAWPAAPRENLLVARHDSPRTYVRLAFPLKLDAHDPLVPAVELLLDAVAGGDDAPLQQALTSGAAPAAMTVSLGLTRRAGAWSTVDFEATLEPGKPHGPVLDALARALRELGTGGAARARLPLVRTAARAAEVLGADQIHYYALTHAGALLEAPPGWLDQAPARFDAVTDEDLDRAARALGSALAGARVLVMGPGVVDGRARWEPPAPVVAPTAARQRRLQRTLPNGLVAIAERSEDSQVFAVHVLLRPRAASEPAEKAGIASFLHRLMGRGTAGLDAAALSARLARLGASLKTDDDPRVPYDDYATGPEFSFVRLELPAEGWRDALALLAEMLSQPRLASDDVEAVRREMLDVQKQRGASSRNRAVEELERRLAPEHPAARPVLGTPTSVAAITAEDLRAFHARYVTGRRAIVTVVSSVDPSSVLDAIAAGLGALPAGDPIAEIPPPRRTDAAAEHRAAAPGDQVTIAMASLFDARPEDEVALALAGAMLSDALSFELRERRGLAYSMGASIAPWAGRMRLLVTMGTRRDNVEEALEGLRAGIAAFTPGEDAAVRRAAAALRGRMLMRRLTRINQAYFLGLDAMAGREPGSDLRRLEALLRLDRDAVVRALGGRLDPARLVVVVE